MKARRHRKALTAETPFTYALLGNIDIHDNDLFNFTGVRECGAAGSYVGLQRIDETRRHHPPRRRSSYLHFQDPSSSYEAHVDAEDSLLTSSFFASVEDSAERVWLISQLGSAAAPSGRNFHTPVSPMYSSPLGVDDENASRWLDVQTSNRSLIIDVLSYFPVTQDTVEQCCYSDDMDRIVAHPNLGYFFFNLVCTPVGHDNEMDGPRAAKSVSQRRLEAAMNTQSSAFSSMSTSVSVIVFPNWIITVHEEPFHELDDLLRFIHMNCVSQSVTCNGRPRPVQRMTTPFIFSSLLQIVVGHQLDTVSMIRAVDMVGKLVFLPKHNEQHNDEVVERLTNVRRCFAGYAAELMRREHIVSVLLQPHMMNSFFTRCRVVRGQLEGVQSYLLRMCDEVSDCRDTVALTNWYHNVTVTWDVLERGNRALRQMVLFAELINILYPVITLQTIYAMNVPLPYSYEAEPPSTTLIPFLVILAIVMLCFVACLRILYVLRRRRHWSTRMLAE
uniref:Uncharacterized protein n=1 Tax=Trypanosoma vivax (strain Y486) TaxID=1055687 RepID=G0U6K4_TRYVY|nr:conserved hypothetical protein, fragment [Trypanosoma vivax Y486]